MSKITLTDLVNLENQNTAVNGINTNNTVLETALDNTLSRDGTAPNQMLSSLDMNSHQILNLPNPLTQSSPLRLEDLNTFIGGGTIEAIPTGGTSGQVLTKASNVNFDVAWSPPVANPSYNTNALAAAVSLPATTKALVTFGYYSQGDGGGGTYIRTTANPGHNFSIRTLDRFLPDGSTSSSNGGWWLGVTGGNLVNIKNHGTKGDGSTDDAPAIRSAYAQAVPGQNLYVPYGNYYCNSTVNSAVLDNGKSIGIIGEGWAVNGSIGGAQFILGPSIADFSDFIHLYNSSDRNIYSTTFKDFCIRPYTGFYTAGVGRHAIYIDGTGTQNYFEYNLITDRVFFGNMKTGDSIKSFSDPANLGGGALNNSLITNCNLMSVNLKNVGDNVTIFRNTFGQQELQGKSGLIYDQVSGATSVNILYNLFANVNGQVIVNSGVSPQLIGNEFESTPGVANTHGSMIDISGATAKVLGGLIAGNTISQLSTVGTIYPISTDVSENLTIVNNRISIPSGSTFHAISSVNTTNLAFNNNYTTTNGVAVDASIANSSGSINSTKINIGTANGTDLLNVGGVVTVSGLHMPGSTSGICTLLPPPLGGGSIRLPAGSVDFVTTGGSGQVIQQSSTGAAFTVGTLSASNLSNGVTGTGAVVLATSPTLVTPALGTPVSGVATNLTGTAAGLTAGTVTTNANLTGAITSVGNAASLGSFTSANLASALTDETGTGANVFATSPTLVTPALGTPASGVATNLTGTASGLTAGNVTTNANLTGVITSVGNATSIASQTGTGTKFVVDTSPTLITPALGTPTALVLTSATGLPLTTGVTGTLGTANGGLGNTAGAWTSFTPVPVSSAGTFTTATSSGAYYVIGKLVFFRTTVTLTTIGTATGQNFTLALPTGTAAGNAVFIAKETVAGATGVAYVNASGTTMLFEAVSGFIQNGASIRCTGFYEQT